jgi:hypothetical protein
MTRNVAIPRVAGRKINQGGQPMANDRNRTDDLYSGPDRDPRTDMNEEPVRTGAGDDVRGVAEEDDEFEDSDELDEEDDDSDV